MQSAIGKNAFTVDQVTDHLLDAPLAGRIRKIGSLFRQGRKQGQRRIKLPRESRGKVTIWNKHYVFAVIRRVFSRFRSSRHMPHSDGYRDQSQRPLFQSCVVPQDVLTAQSEAACLYASQERKKLRLIRIIQLLKRARRCRTLSAVGPDRIDQTGSTTVMEKARAIGNPP